MADFTVPISNPPNPPEDAALDSTLAISTPSSCVPRILNPFDPHLPLPDHERDPLYLLVPQTWAERNPTLGTQKEHHRVKPTDTARATKKITAKYNKAQAARLSTDIEKLVQMQQTQIKKITQDHS